MAVIFFLQFLVIKSLDPDPYWIRIRIGIQPKMLDPDEMNADPQPCKGLKNLLHTRTQPVGDVNSNMSAT